MKGNLSLFSFFSSLGRRWSAGVRRLYPRAQKTFVYERDRRCRRITWGVTIGLAVIFLGMVLLSQQQYFSAWVIFFVLSVLALEVLSIPRFITLNDEALEIHCVVDLTRIHVEDIESIRRIGREEFRHLTPLLGSYGFGGYFGYYFDFSSWNFYKLYATERKRLVLIEDIYEDAYIVSCTDPDALVAGAIRARDRKREEIFRASMKNESPSSTADFFEP